jgi:hypothetical protein
VTFGFEFRAGDNPTVFGPAKRAAFARSQAGFYLDGFSFLGAAKVRFMPSTVFATPRPDDPLHAGGQKADTPNTKRQHRQREMQFPIEMSAQKRLKMPTARAISSDTAAWHDGIMTQSRELRNQ